MIALGGFGVGSGEVSFVVLDQIQAKVEICYVWLAFGLLISDQVLLGLLLLDYSQTNTQLY